MVPHILILLGGVGEHRSWRWLAARQFLWILDWKDRFLWRGIASVNCGILATTTFWLSMSVADLYKSLFHHTITHSLVDLPRRGLATADDHSDIFLLHCTRSCDISFSWMYSQPVHSSMSCIYCLLGLPWCRSPSMIPSRTVSANCPALPRVIWPKYCSVGFCSFTIQW